MLETMKNAARHPFAETVADPGRGMDRPRAAALPLYPAVRTEGEPAAPELERD
ncbi:hypothetical protein ACGFZQ_39300 [Streptomyces sp. NPDC048254]|uniref:hypothetical protein n=1 Tax=Streptomyces sp. NPDC048254 TaxID=3365525 RepID=UPI0037236A0F